MCSVELPSGQTTELVSNGSFSMPWLAASAHVLPHRTTAHSASRKTGGPQDSSRHSSQLGNCLTTTLVTVKITEEGYASQTLTIEQHRGLQQRIVSCYTNEYVSGENLAWHWGRAHDQTRRYSSRRARRSETSQTTMRADRRRASQMDGAEDEAALFDRIRGR